MFLCFIFATEPQLSQIPSVDQRVQQIRDSGGFKALVEPLKPEFLHSGFVLRDTEPNQISFSLMILNQQNEAPLFTVQDRSIKPEKFYAASGWNLWRYEVQDMYAVFGVGSFPYSIGDKFKGSVSLPRNNDARRIFYTCCNKRDEEGTDENWGKVWKEHENNPFTLSLRGGDENYLDAVLQLPSIKDWISRLRANGVVQNAVLKEDFTGKMREEVEQFCFEVYFSRLKCPNYQKVLRAIMRVVQRDDHEGFDGDGSLPEKLQNCPVIQGIRSVTTKFFLLFHHHMRPEEAEKFEYFGEPGKGYSKIYNLHMLAIASMDLRGERTQEQVMAQSTYTEMFKRLEALPKTCRFVLLMLSVPLVLPSSPDFMRKYHETKNPYIDPAQREHSPSLVNLVLDTMKVSGGKDAFGIPEEVDDAWYDPWGAKVHEAERNTFIALLAAFAKKRFDEGNPIRIVPICGDIHAATIGKVDHSPLLVDPRHDPYHMTQVVGPPIGSKWPNERLKMLSKMLEAAAYVERTTISGSSDGPFALKLSMNKWGEMKNFFYLGRGFTVLMPEKRQVIDAAPEAIVDLLAELHTEGGTRYSTNIPGLASDKDLSAEVSTKVCCGCFK